MLGEGFRSGVAEGWESGEGALGAIGKREGDVRVLVDEGGGVVDFVVDDDVAARVSERGSSLGN